MGSVISNIHTKKILIRLVSVLLISIITGCSSDNSLQWHAEEGYKWAELDPGFWGETGFQKINAESSGIHFANTVPDSLVVQNQVVLNGSGVTAGDVDGDGLQDLYFARLDGPNSLYKNKGSLTFEEITQQAGVAHKEQLSTGAFFADINSSGALDLIVTSINKSNSIYINDGKGSFSLKEDSGLGEAQGSTTAAVADVDGDGDPDLYITNYKKRSAKDIFGLKQLQLWNITTRKAGRYQLKEPYDKHFKLFRRENGPPDFRETGSRDILYLNDGTGRFQPAADLRERFRNADGKPMGLKKDWGLTAKFQDLNADGLPDLYVSNDFWTPDRIWINQGEGMFRLIHHKAIRNFSFSSMAVDFSDINRNGYTDIFITEMLSPLHQRRLRQQESVDPYPEKVQETSYQPRYSRNSLYLNRGDNTYAQVAHYAGVAATEWSWATKFADIDLDGYEDILINTGYAYDVQDLDAQRAIGQKMGRKYGKYEDYMLEFPSLRLRNKAFRNNGDGTFSEQSSNWGFTGDDISQGMAMTDLDNDGDLDMVTNRYDSTAALYENSSSEHRIAVKLRGESPNTQAIGARVSLSGGPVSQSKEVTVGGDYLSSSEPLTVFAATDQANHSLTAEWPGGSQSQIEGLKSNRIYEIDERKIKKEELRENKKPAEEQPSIFEDISDRIGHEHSIKPSQLPEQPLLPFDLSGSGPGLAWFDDSGNGYDDLWITGTRGNDISLYENKNGVDFSETEAANFSESPANHQQIIRLWETEDEIHVVIAKSIPSRNRDQNGPGAIVHYRIKNGNVLTKNELPWSGAVSGALALGDYTGNGHLDLFAGARFFPNKYPGNTSSYLYKNRGDTLVVDEQNNQLFDEMGPVSGALFADMENDGDHDLFVATEWSAIRLFRNDEGRFREITGEAGLRSQQGIWKSITAGDFNSDGLLDIAATNMGLNSSYQIKSGKPLKLFYDDFNRDGITDIIESYFVPELNAYAPRRKLNDFSSMPAVMLQNIRSHEEFAGASLQKLLGPSLNDIPVKTVNTLEHTIFINQGGSFKPRPLSSLAQQVIASASVVADFDNDGNEDLFLAQNKFDMGAHLHRQDAGRGLFLQGNGDGSFKTIAGQHSGIKIYGEQTSAATSDFNHDGKVDLAVSQTGGATRLFQNDTSESGIMVKLIGPPDNRSGIGARIRLKYENRTLGPARNVTTNAGARGQSSLMQILGSRGKLAAIIIHWPDGKKQIVSNPDVKEINVIDYKP